MVARCQLTFRFGKVERAAVTFCVSGYQIDNEGDHRRDVSLEYKPSVGLALYDFGELHGTHQYHHRQDTESHGQFVTDDLCTASHGTDQ